MQGTRREENVSLDTFLSCYCWLVWAVVIPTIILGRNGGGKRDDVTKGRK